MAELIHSRDYWMYEYNEEAILIKPPVRGNRDDEDFREWDYGGYQPQVGDRLRVVENRDSDNELSVVFVNDPHEEQVFIWDGCVEPAVKPIPEDVDLSRPDDIEKFLENS